MIMGSRRYGARFGTAVANVGDLNLDGYEGKQWSYKGWTPRLLSLSSMPFALFTNWTMLFFAMFTHISALIRGKI
jgi:hypothetical protein